MRQARAIASRTSHTASLSDVALDHDIAALRETFRRGRDEPGDAGHAFALIREAARRTLGLLPHVEQMAAALALNAGFIAEMATGEGKTLVATLPAVLEGWRGRGCHVITVNDYLAKRDAQRMQPLYDRCGVRVAWIEQAMTPEDRRDAYAADVTYLTNKEAAADHLRDRLTMGDCGDVATFLLNRLGSARHNAPPLVMRGLACAIVDEADSVLVDEAVTPLIIAGEVPGHALADACRQAASVSESFTRGRHFRVDEQYREISLTARGSQAVAEAGAALGGLWRSTRRAEELVVQALTARELYQRNQHYVIRDDRVFIVDESTGRLMPDRSWRDAMHQAIEIKERLPPTPMKETLARISFQRFFRKYRRLCGMSGTVREVGSELWRVYDRPLVVLPTHRPCIRARWPDRVFATADAKWRAVIEHVKELHVTHRPILIGTRSVDASEQLSAALRTNQIPHHVLNAVRHDREAQIIAQAGQRGAVTVATNMAGRGTDIALGPGVASLGGLHVIATERHESARIDRQLFGRAGRQGDPGSAVMFASLEDDLVRRYSRRVDRIIGAVAPRLLFSRLQRRAETNARAQRWAVLKADEWSDEHFPFT